MTRCLVWLLIWLPATVGAAPLLVTIEPTAPVLGKPLTLVIPLPEPHAVLAGLPDLGSFELLAPPLRSGDAIRLVVLPMRSGPRELPPFPLQVGSSRLVETAPRTVTVLEGIAREATLAPYKRRPIPLVGQGRDWLLPAAIAALFLTLGGWFLWRRLSRIDFADLPTAAQLESLQHRLSQGAPSERRHALLQEIERRRFGPVVTGRDDLARLRQDVLSLLEKRP